MTSDVTGEGEITTAVGDLTTDTAHDTLLLTTGDLLVQVTQPPGKIR